MKMYEQIENILTRTLSPFEYEKIEELLKDYTEENNWLFHYLEHYDAYLNQKGLLEQL